MNRLSLHWIPLFAALLVAPLATPLGASAQRTPTQRYSVNQRGDIALVGNTAMHCTGSGAACVAARSTTGIGGPGTDNGFTMRRVDADDDPSTSMSSGATLSLPTGATISRAFLYWSCTAPTSAGDARREVRFRAPGGGYERVTATLFDSGMSVASQPYYQGMANVTSRMNGDGVYWVADMRCTEGATNLFGGWTLVIVYADPSVAMRNLVVYDAYGNYSTTPLTFAVSGFLTPATGTVASRVGIVAWDGDRGDGDSLRLISGASNTLLGETPGASALNPNDDIGNSTITAFGAVMTGRFPAYGNTLGYDQDLFETTGALPNGATSATIRAQTTGEGIGIGVLTFATDIYAPEMSATKTASVADTNTSGTVDAGDVITYTIAVRNGGRDALIDSVLTDPLPAGTAFVAGSLRVDGVAPAASLFSVDAGTLTVRLGTGADATHGGRIAPGATITVTFQVRITSTGGGVAISNQATIGGHGETVTTQTFSAATDGDSTTAGEQPTIITTTDRCGDGARTGAESCDDGNTVGGDGCSAMCRAEVDIDGPSGTVLTNTPTFTGTAHPGATVTIAVSGTTLGTATADATGHWTFTPSTALAEGPQTVTASATDDLSNTTTDTTMIVVDTRTFVTITAPTEGSTTGDTTPTITGTGEPGATVEVFVDEASIGTVTVGGDGTWSIDVPSMLGFGPHEVRAEATDTSGHTATSPDVGFTVADGTYVDITGPADGAIVTSSTPTITGTGEPGASISVTIGGTTLTTTVAGDGTWSVTPTSAIPDGTYTVTATATDGEGHTASDTIQLTIDASTRVAFLQPGDQGAIGDTTPELSGTGEPGAQVAISIDGTLVGTVTVDAEGNWTFLVPSELAEGTHDVSVTATDASGNTATDTGSFEVDVTAPSLEIRNVADNATTNDATPTLTGSSEPGRLVTVIVDGSIVGTALTNVDGTWSLALTTPLADGPHTVSATTTDAAGNTANDEHNFTVDTSAPDVAITSPASGERVSDATPTITGTSEPGATVELFVDGALIGTVTAGGDGRWSVPTTRALADGEHTVRAVASDPAGNTATTSGGFVVDTETHVAIVRPEDEGTTGSSRPIYFGTAEPGASVVISVDGTEIGTVVAGADGRWFIAQPTDLTVGDHTVRADATDTVGNTATTSNDFAYDPSLGDADGDGIPDSVECPSLPDTSACPDTDGDGTPDYLDPDDDGDGVPTADECTNPTMCRDTDGDGTPDYLDGDDDGDGIATRDERPGNVSIDTDGDGIPNYLDPDDDGDGIATREECATPTACRDTDSDGTPDYLDPDDDGDGILTSRERADGMRFGDDVDGDGVPNWLDTDSDGDGLSDREEGLGDDDGDGIPNYLDPRGSTGVDGGMGDVDGGAGNADAGAGDADAGGERPPVGGGFAGGACGCSVPGSSSGGAPWLALSIFGVVIASLRRRSRGRREPNPRKA